MLLAILVVAAALRVPLPTVAPPGLNQDEAINAWDTYCLLKTGTDSNGTSWPLLYARGFGSNRSALFLYLLLPFQMIGGLNVATIRVAASLYGVAAVALAYFAGARMFGAATGLVAAGLLAVVPWHVQLSRYAIEPTLCVLLVLLPVSAMLRAGLPLGDGTRQQPSAPWAALAGVLAGGCCYGYPAVRVFLPVFLIAAAVVAYRRWLALAGTRRGRHALAAFVLGVAVTFGPLLLRHITDPEGIGERGAQTWVWSSEDRLPIRIAKALRRFPAHYGPDFLFLRGDHYEIQAPPGGGQLRWFMLPLLLVGAASAARRSRASVSARVLLAMMVTYPAGDLVSSTLDGCPHAMRSLPGLGSLVLLAAVGAVAAWEWLAARSRRVALAAAAALGVAAGAETARFVWLFFGEFTRRPAIYHGFHVDLMAACERLRPRFASLDAVLVTATKMNMPYAVMLVGLGYQPADWFSVRHRIVVVNGWELHIQDGKLFTLYSDDWRSLLPAVLNNRHDDHVVFLVRPGELGLNGCTMRIDGPEGTLPLLICEQTL